MIAETSSLIDAIETGKTARLGQSFGQIVCKRVQVCFRFVKCLRQICACSGFGERILYFTFLMLFNILFYFFFDVTDRRFFFSRKKKEYLEGEREKKTRRNNEITAKSKKKQKKN